MFLLFAVIFAVLSGCIAHTKGRNVILWSILGFLIGLFGLILVAVLPNLRDQKQKEAHAEEENRRLREQLRQERIKSESFRQYTSARLDAHDQHLGLDTRTAGPALAGPDSGPIPLLEDSTNDWYYSNNGQSVGPVPVERVVELIRLRVIKPETLVWTAGNADWQQASHFPGFAKEFA